MATRKCYAKAFRIGPERPMGPGGGIRRARAASGVARARGRAPRMPGCRYRAGNRQPAQMFITLSGYRAGPLSVTRRVLAGRSRTLSGPHGKNSEMPNLNW